MKHTSKQKKQLLMFVALGLGSVSVIAGCGTNAAASNPAPANTPSPASSASSSVIPVTVPLSTLIAKAKAEGTVHGFGMPSNWANLGSMWTNFQKQYGIKTLYQAEGNMSSGQELQAFQSEKNHPVGDVGDIGISFGPTAVKMGVVAPFKNKYWSQIPANLKDPGGHWAAAYYGVTAFEINTNKVKNVPTTWADLLKPQYKGMIGFADPRQAAVSLDAVIAAAYAFGGSVNNIEPGLKFFAKLKKIGNWTGANYSTAAMQTGQIDIGITWNYLAEGDQKQFAGKPPIKVVVPSDGAVAGPYVEVVNKYAPHPYAARLLNTYLFSNAGQISYAEGGAYPVRLPYLKLPKSVQLPPLNRKSVHFLSGNLSKAQSAILNGWGPQVLGQ